MPANVNDSEQKYVTWICSMCGYKHVGLTQPKQCPQCGMGKFCFYKILVLKYDDELSPYQFLTLPKFIKYCGDYECSLQFVKEELGDIGVGLPKAFRIMLLFLTFVHQKSTNFTFRVGIIVHFLKVAFPGLDLFHWIIR